ncbi:MAG: cysteine hydrolase [Methanosarcinales archaeon]|jgi:ureidoacrylate peracid hydrolase|nr:cysteine hydrolase [Methanosarcinales archaeon]
MSEDYVKWEFEREKCVLMVIDMQNDFVLDGAIMQIKEAGKQVPKIQKLISKCRELDIPTIYTVHKTDPRYCPLEIAAFPHLKDGGMREGTDGIKVVDDLKPSPNDVVLYKYRFSAFYQTDLEVILRNIRNPSPSADTIIICGTVTNICCESTARDAFFRDYKVVFGTDICSADDKEAHDATLKNMEIFGRPMDCETIIKALENGRG